MPSLATVISLVYCSGVAWPGMTALFRPSMPMEMAPLRFTLALSSSSTRSLGFFSLAFTAAIGPPVPPPTTTMSYSSSIVFMPAFLCSKRLDGHAIHTYLVLEGVAPVVQVFVVDRHAVRCVGGALDHEHGRAF